MKYPRVNARWAVTLLALCTSCTTVSDDQHGARSWGTAERIDQEDLWTENPHVGMDANGNAIVVWLDISSPNDNVWARRNTRDDGWGAAQRLDDNGETQEYWAYRPGVAMAAGGEALAVWMQGWGPGVRRTAWAKHFVPESGWGTAVRLDVKEAGDALDPVPAVNPEGHAMVVWRQLDGAWFNVWANRFTPGEGWSGPSAITALTASHAIGHQVDVGPDGNAIAVWREVAEGHSEIWSSRFTPMDGWQAPRRIDADAAGTSRSPAVAMDADGNAIALWLQSDGLSFGVYANRYTRGGSWGTPKRIDADPDGDAEDVTVGFDGEGNALALWKQLGRTDVDIWASRYVPGEDWGEAERIETNDEGDAVSPRLAVSANGDAVAVWLQSDGFRYDVWSNAYEGNLGWGIAEQVDRDPTDPQSGAHLRLAIDASGNAMAVWTREGEQPNVELIWAARYE